MILARGQAPVPPQHQTPGPSCLSPFHLPVQGGRGALVLPSLVPTPAWPCALHFPSLADYSLPRSNAMGSNIRGMMVGIREVFYLNLAGVIC